MEPGGGVARRAGQHAADAVQPDQERLSLGHAVAATGRRGKLLPGRNCACRAGDWPANLPTLPDGFADGFARTSPVGSFAANPLGYFDLGGNAWEMVRGPFRFRRGNPRAARRLVGQRARGFATLQQTDRRLFPTRAAISMAFASCWRRRRSGTWKSPASRPARRFSRRIARSGRRPLILKTSGRRDGGVFPSGWTAINRWQSAAGARRGSAVAARAAEVRAPGRRPGSRGRMGWGCASCRSARRCSSRSGRRG